MVSSVLSAATSQVRVSGSPERLASSLPVSAAAETSLDRGLLTLQRQPLFHGDAWSQSVEPHLAWERSTPLGAGSEAPVFVVLGGISAGRHVVDSEQPGWWSSFAGVGRPIDSRRASILSFDYLGGNGASTGPRSHPEVQSWPAIDARDQADALLQLLDALEIERLTAMVGSSYGGAVALAFGQRHPSRVERLVVISSAEASHPQTTAYRTVQRRIVRQALARGRGEPGLRLARSLAMIGYRSPQEFAARFGGRPERTDGGFRFPVEDYLEARGDDFANHFVAQAFLNLSESLDLHRIDPARVTVATELIGVFSDQIVPLFQLEELRPQLAGRTRLHVLDSLYGHDAFLKETEQLGSLLASLLFESETGGRR